MPKSILSFLFVYLFLSANAQEQITPYNLLPYSFSKMRIPLVSPVDTVDIRAISLKKDDDLPEHFRKLDSYDATHLYTYKDGTFLFYYIEQSGTKMALGQFQRSRDTLELFCDSVKTEAAVSDPTFYKKFFRFSKPVPLKLNDWKYVRTLDGLESYSKMHEEKISVLKRLGGEFIGNKELDLLKTSQEIFEPKGEVISQFREIKYGQNGSTLLIFHGNNQKTEVPLSGIWGFVIYEGESAKVYRCTQQGFNWFGIPGAQVAQVDSLVFYTVGESRLYSYFSRDLNSPIFPLTLQKLKKIYADNPKFIDLLNHHFKNRSPSDLDEHYHGYKVAELYRRSKGLIHTKTLEQHFVSINSIKQAREFVKQNPDLKAKLLALNSETDINSPESHLLNKAQGDLFIHDNHWYKVLEVKNDTFYKASSIFLDGGLLSSKKIDSLRTVIVAELDKGVSFEKLSNMYTMDDNTKGGNLDWFTGGVMVQEFEQAVKNHNKGEIFTVDVPSRKWHYIVQKTADNKKRKTVTLLTCER